MNCSSLDDNLTSLVLPTTLASSTKLIKQRANRTTTFSPILKNDQNTISQPKNIEISKNTFSKEYGNTVLTDVRDHLAEFSISIMSLLFVPLVRSIL